MITINLIRYLKNNWPYLFMLSFIVFMNLALPGEKGKPKKEGIKISAETANEKPYRTALIDSDSFKERQEKINKLMTENLPVYLILVAVNLGIFLLFFAGFFLNIQIIYKVSRRERIITPSFENNRVRWGIGDVIRVSVMFYAFAYLFMAFEGKMMSIFPILDNETFLVILNAAVTDTAGIIFVLNFVLLVYKLAPSDIGLTLKDFFRNVGYGIAGYIAIIPVLFLTLLATAFLLNYFKLEAPVQPIVDMIIKEKKMPVLVFASIFAAVLGPVMEEIFFRGFMYNAVKKKIGVLWSILGTAIVFSLLHAHPIGFAPILILGILLAYLYEKTGSLVPSMTVHIIHNLASLVVLFIVKTANL